MADPPLTSEAQRVQAAWTGFHVRFDELARQAASQMAQGAAQAAHQANRDALTLVDSFYAEWEPAILAGARLAGLDAQFSGLIRDDRISALWAASSTAAVVGEVAAARAWLATARSLLPDEPSLMRAMVRDSAASLAAQHADYPEAIRLYASAATDYEAVSSWEARVQALAALANCAYSAGDEREFARVSQQAIAEANAHGLAERASRLDLQWLSFRMKGDEEGAVPEHFRTERRRLKNLSADPVYQIDVAVALGEFAESIGDRETAREEYLSALERAREHPAKQWVILQTLVRLEQDGNVPQALAYAERGLALSREAGVAGQVLQSLQSLVELRMVAGEPEVAGAHLAELRQTADPETLCNVLSARALAFAKAQRWDAALADLAEARGLASNPGQERSVRFATAGVLTKAGRLEEALGATDEALRAAPGAAAMATLEENAAGIEARLGRPERAVVRCEHGRGQAPGADAGEMQAWIEREQVAVAWFSVTGHGTLVLIAEPGRPPAAHFAPLTEHDLATLLPAQLSDSEWNRTLVAAVPEISRRLASALDLVSGRGRVLYLCPDSRLFRLPFAALSFADGSHLVDRCALAFAPSLGLARQCLGHAGGARTLLAAGAGEAGPYSFNTQAGEVARFPGWASATFRSEVSLEEFLRQAPQHAVLHLACHGLVEASVLEGMAASRLILGNHEALTAKAVAALALRADLVFLNACTSGVYQTKLRGETGGFWRAFLGAGAASLIATLSYVDPGAAQEVALGFYRTWNTGDVSKAEALRRAQLARKAAGGDLLDWSAHVLIGSHR